MPKSSKAGQHRAEAVEQDQSAFHFWPRHQMKQLNRFEGGGGFGGLAAGTSEPRQSVATGTARALSDAEEG